MEPLSSAPFDIGAHFLYYKKRPSEAGAERMFFMRNRQQWRSFFSGVAVTALVFSLLYFFTYSLTARTYYKLVGHTI